MLAQKPKHNEKQKLQQLRKRSSVFEKKRISSQSIVRFCENVQNAKIWYFIISSFFVDSYTIAFPLHFTTSKHLFRKRKQVTVSSHKDERSNNGVREEETHTHIDREKMKVRTYVCEVVSGQSTRYEHNFIQFRLANCASTFTYFFIFCIQKNISGFHHKRTNIFCCLMYNLLSIVCLIFLFTMTPCKWLMCIIKEMPPFQKKKLLQIRHQIGEKKRKRNITYFSNT